MVDPSQTETLLDAEIQSALSELKTLDRNSDEYGDLVNRISQLHKLKTEEVEQNTKLHKLETENRFGFSKRISADTALLVGANLVSIIWITQHERLHPITTKALGFVLRPR